MQMCIFINNHECLVSRGLICKQRRPYLHRLMLHHSSSRDAYTALKVVGLYVSIVRLHREAKALFLLTSVNTIWKPLSQLQAAYTRVRGVR